MTTEKNAYVLMLTKWYPYDKDPQFGVFIRKHALAIANQRDIVVYSYHSHLDEEKKRFQLEVEKHGRLTEYRMYFKKSNSIFSPISNTLNYLRAWQKSIEVILRNHGLPGIVHAYILLRPAILGYFFSKRHKIPFVISEQWSGYTNGNFQRKSFPIKWLNKFLFNSANARILVSEFLKSSMHKLGFSSEVNIIPNVIEEQSPPPANLSEKIKILVVADLIDEIKNISSVLKSFSRAQKENSNLHLTIIGQGKDEKELKALAQLLGLTSDGVIFEGLKSNKEVYEALWDCDFLIMNSRFETFSLICAEAFSCGKPVIATRCGGPEEFVNEKNGILIPTDDENALFKAIVSMSSTYKSFSATDIRNESIMKFSPVSTGLRFEAIYSLLNK